MAHDEMISEPIGNDVHRESPASASALAQVPDVATLRAMMHERQYAAGKALEQQLAGVLKTGLSDSLTRATVIVRTFTFNWLLLTVASAGAVAALSMLSSVNSFASSVTIGVGQTATLLCGIFFGEEDRGALKATLRTGMRMGLVLSCALCTLVLRMRDNGAAFNPMDLDLSAADPCSAVGIRMLRQGVREVEYQNTVGFNNVVVTLPAASR